MSRYKKVTTSRMAFEGSSLKLIQRSIDLAMAEVHDQIATCPSPLQFQEAIEELENTHAQLTKLLERITAKVGPLD